LFKNFGLLLFIKKVNIIWFLLKFLKKILSFEIGLI